MRDAEAALAPARILLVEDDAPLRRAVARCLGRAGHEVVEALAGDEALQQIRDPHVDAYELVIADLRSAGADGIEVLRAARDRNPRSSVILMGAHPSLETAVEAMRLGAFDVVQKPFELAQLEERVCRAIRHARLLRDVSVLAVEGAHVPLPEVLIGRSPRLRAALDLARRVAPTRSTVLITGETGTGKELVARIIHRFSPRAARPFVQVNCAALPETLLESELFGHERGAFTGAERLRIGRFEQANGGTLFLDEIGDMSAATQAKLLRVLEDQEFHRLGGIRSLRTDARIVAATHQDLERAIGTGAFREDLFFRLNVIGIELPTLRERPEDVEALARHFLEHFSRELGRPSSRLTAAALERIRSHRWPGNVRELRNAIERAALLADGPEIGAAQIGLDAGALAAPGGEWCPELPPGGISLREVERRLVLAALRRTGYVQKDAAGLLGISRRKLNYMIQRMGLTHPSWRRNSGRGAGESEPASSAGSSELP